MAKSRTTVETTERSGPARLVFGCLFIALGLLWLMGITFRDATQFNLLRLFRDNAHGLCGVLNSLLPLFSIFGGAMLAVSSRHPVRSRFFWIPAAMFVLLCGILTLTARVSTTGLVDYVRVTIGREMRMMNPDSLPACLIGAYNVRSFNNGMLAGGGLLGMTVAYPLYTILNTATGIAVLVIAEIALFLWLIRFDVSAALALIGKTAANAAARRKAQQRPEPEAVEEAEPEPMTDVEPPRVFIPTQQVRFTTTVSSDPIAEYLVPEADPQSYREQIIEQQNMFSARQEVPFEPVISIEKPDPQPPVKAEPVFEPIIAVTDEPVRDEVPQPIEAYEPQPSVEPDPVSEVDPVPEQPVEPPQRRRRSSRVKETQVPESIVQPVITRTVQEEEPLPTKQETVFRQEQPIITEVLPQDAAEPRRRRSAMADPAVKEPDLPIS
ncbi:MAG: hypothetical protein MJ136_05345 [Clostridia bacterium]|nr:hypothetical protein [Clostridia bacterium]